MTPGQFLLRFYHTPLNRLRDSLRNGGPWIERETERHRLQMIEASRNLPSLPQPSGVPRLTVHEWPDDVFTAKIEALVGPPIA